MSEERPLETGWLADTPVDDSVLRRFLFNQADSQEHLTRAVSGRVERTPDVVLCDSGTPAAYLNQAVLLRPLVDADDPVLAEIDAFYAGHAGGVVLSAWPTADLSLRGWHLVGHPMFVARGATAVDAGTPAGVDIRVARTAAELALVEHIVAEGYPVDELAGITPNSAFGAALSDAPLRCRIAYLDGEPVAAGASLVAHGVVNLCLAATLPAARRRGVWQSLVSARCADAPDLPALAFTSDLSRPGFVRMGFLPLQRFTLWAVSG